MGDEPRSPLIKSQVLINLYKPIMFDGTHTHTHTHNIATHLPTFTKGKDASVLKLPCDATTAEYCYWTPVKTNAGANTLQVDIPCGLKDHTTLVVVGTVSMTIFGTLYLTYVAASVVIS